MIKSRARAAAKLAPMKHQLVSLAHDKTTPIVFDTSDPGTGKTAVRIWAFAERRRKRGGCGLVLAPLSLVDSAWADDFKKFAPDMKVSVATAENREKAFAVDADVYITNVDGVKWLAKQKKPFWTKFSELIIDESTAFKHHSSQRSRAAAKIASLFKRRACLTGTPNGRSICDVWHQVKLLDDGKRLGPSFYAFRNSVCEGSQVHRNASFTKWEDREGAEEAVFALLADITVRHKFEECVDIPKQLLYERNYKLPKVARAAYDDMERNHLLPMIVSKQVTARLRGKPAELTAVNAAAVGSKLLQLASGAVYDNDRVVRKFDGGRYKLVMDLAEERKHPLVFYLWEHQRDYLVEEAEKRGMTFAVYGDGDRAATVRAYQAGKFDVLFAHPQTAAHGLTLTKGTSTIWASPTSNLEWWTQGNKRQYRMTQTEKTEVIVVLAEGTVDHHVYHGILAPRAKRMNNFLDLFQAMTHDFAEAA